MFRCKLSEKVSPRIVPARDEKYMGLAFWIASFSKDPTTQVGAIIVSENNRPLGIGYNGPPRQISDDTFSWSRPEKYPYMVHAERNALDHSHKPIDKATIYVTAPPCKDCMLDIVASGVVKVVYHKSLASTGSMINNNENWIITQEIATKANVTLVEFQGDLVWMQDRIVFMEHLGIFK